MGDENSKDELSIVRAQKRLWRLHKRFRRNGGWRAVAEEIGVPNVSYVFDFVTRGKLPANLEIREALMRGRRAVVAEARPMDGRMQRLYDLMRTGHVGKAQGIKKRELLLGLYGAEAAADESYNNLYDRELRAMIEELICHHAALICSNSSDGYWWASSLNEGLHAVEQSMKRPRKQMFNLGRLEANLQRKFGGQMELEVEG